MLVGHSHAALHVALRGDGRSTARLAPTARSSTSARRAWLLNPGSVGQPRDGDPRAAYLVLDLDARTASFRRVEYDVERTQAEMRDGRAARGARRAARRSAQ